MSKHTYTHTPCYQHLCMCSYNYVCACQRGRGERLLCLCHPDPLTPTNSYPFPTENPNSGTRSEDNKTSDCKSPGTLPSRGSVMSSVFVAHGTSATYCLLSLVLVRETLPPLSTSLPVPLYSLALHHCLSPPFLPSSLSQLAPHSGTRQARSGFEQSPPATTGELMGLSLSMMSQTRQVEYVIAVIRNVPQ